jgi:hypothetical protein
MTTSIIGSMTYVREGKAIHNPEVYEEHAKALADEVERLKDIIRNTTHGRKKPKEDMLIWDSIYMVSTDDRIFILGNEDGKKIRRVTTVDDFYDPERQITYSDAMYLMERKEAFRIPTHMNYGGENYAVIDNNVIHYSFNKLDDDGSFHDWMSMWIPQPDKKKYVQLSMSMLGQDRFGDRIFMDTYHYKSEESWQSPYTTKRLQRAGAYSPYVVKMLEFYRERTNRPDFLKKQK